MMLGTRSLPPLGQARGDEGRQRPMRVLLCTIPLDVGLPRGETDDPVAAARVVASWTAPGDWILVKASRGMRLERVIDALRQVVEAA